ncbi:MAG: hypothetical protein L0227_12320 [Chloroflexi bacterium]|nr:hypothetical protein [Chloroflexota bacterium]
MADSPMLVERVVAAMGRLVALGETIEDEWTYVHDLEVVWVARLRAVAAARATVAVPAPGSIAGPEATDLETAALDGAALEAAVDRLVAEADMVGDPHRAIDWLSTLPQATLVALGETAW